jgi:hypothetical protein
MQGECLERPACGRRRKSLNKLNFDELKSAISNLKYKLPVIPTAACSVEMSQPSESSFVPATLALDANNSADSNNEKGGLVCPCNLVSCNVCTNGGVSD